MQGLMKENQPQQQGVSSEEERKKLEGAHLKELYYLYYKVKKLTQRHDAQKKDLERYYQNLIKSKDHQIKSLQRQLQQTKNANKNSIDQIVKVLNAQHNNVIGALNSKGIHLEQNVTKLKKENQELTQVLKMYEELEKIFIQQKELRPTTIYNKYAKAVQKGFLNNDEYTTLKQDYKINDEAYYLNIPEKILNDKNIKLLQELLIKNQWEELEHLRFLTQASLQIKQKSHINDQLWKTLVKKGEGKQKKFPHLKILDLKNHKILSIGKDDLEQFKSLKKVDLSTTQIDKSNKNNRTEYHKSIEALREYAKQHSGIKIEATLQNDQWVQWYQNNQAFLIDKAN